MNKVDPSVVRQILRIMVDPDMIAFGGGSPARETFPVMEIKNITDDLLDTYPTELLQYGLTEGWVPLRQSFLEHIAKPKQIDADIENILITTGALQAVSLAADVFLNDRDVVLVESPTFFSVLGIFYKYNAVCIPVTCEKDGVSIADLEYKMKKYSPKLFYVIPTFQNPTGRTLTVEKRARIARLAEKYDVIVVEDDPYCDLRYVGDPVPPIKHFDRSGHVVWINSFSKTIAAGFRVGTVVAHPDIISSLASSKQCNDTHAPLLCQAICAEYLNRGKMPEHLEEIRKIYKERLDMMLYGIEEYFPEGTEYQKPDGGLFVWLTLPNNTDTGALLETAIQKYGVNFIQGSLFFVNPEEGINAIRLNFSSNTPERIDKGMCKLGAVFNNV